MNILGFHSEMVYVIVILLAIIGFYLLLAPLIKKLILWRTTKLLSYLTSSLLFITCFFIVVLFNGEIHLLTYSLFKFGLKALAFFGGGLFLYHTFRRLLGNA